jgi:hypothetical protein
MSKKTKAIKPKIYKFKISVILMDLILFLVRIVYFIIPAAFSNMMPVIVRPYFKKLKYPLDFNKKISGIRILGNNKTFRGLIFGILGSIVLILLQTYLYQYNFFRNISLIDYTQINPIIFGFLTGFSVLFGDAVASFIKRRLEFKPGESFFLLDQINGSLGFSIIVLPFYLDSMKLAIWINIVWIIGHLIIKVISYLFKFEKKAI